MASGQAKNPHPISGNGLFVAFPHIGLQHCYKNLGSVVSDLFNRRGTSILTLPALEKPLKASSLCRLLLVVEGPVGFYLHNLPLLAVHSMPRPFSGTIR